MTYYLGFRLRKWAVP